MKTDLRDGRKQHLVTSAQKTFARKGFFSTGIAEIVHEAGIARGTFYQYFDHKLHIFETILDSFLQNLQECIRPIAVGAGAPSPVSQIHDNLSRVLQLVLRARELTHILLRHGSTEDHAVDDQLKDFFRRVAEMIERSLKVGISMNLVRPCNTRLTAYSMIGAVKEVAFEITSSNEAEPPVEEVVRDLIEFGLGGVLVGPSIHLLNNHQRSRDQELALSRK